MIFTSESKNIILIFTLVIIIPLIVYLSQDMLKSSIRDLKTYEDHFQYKIKSFIFTIGVVLSYFLLFILVVLFLRISAYSNIVDLKLFVPIYDVFKSLFFFIQIYIIIFSFIVILFVLRLYLLIETFCMKELLKLFIYLYNYCTHEYLYGRAFSLLCKIGFENDIIAYFFRQNSYYIDYIWKNKYTNTIRNYSTIIFRSRFYKILFNFSPLWIIIYDCYLHNFVLVHLYAYLVFFVPLSLLKRISKKTAIVPYITGVLHLIYYKKETNQLYLIRSDYYPLLELYLKTQFAYNKDLGLQEFDITVAIFSESLFLVNEEKEKTYYNSYGIVVKEIENEYYEVTNEETKGERWLLLAK